MSVDPRSANGVKPARFRELMGRLAGGITVVTTVARDGTPRGLTATAVCAVSLSPPLVLVCLGTDTQTCQAIRDTRLYALNFLHDAGRTLSDRFASSINDKFRGVEWAPGPGGCPILEQTLGWAECEVEQEVEAGDHAILVARLVAGDLRDTGRGPLLHYRGLYHSSARVDE